MWDYRARITEVHDGDTVTLDLDRGFGDVREGMHIRLDGVWAPELSQTGGERARDFVQEWVDRHEIAGLRFAFVVTTTRLPRADREATTFDRYVASIETIDHSSNLNREVSSWLASEGLTGGVGA